MIVRHRPSAGFWRAPNLPWGMLLSLLAAGCGGAQPEAETPGPEASPVEEMSVDEADDGEAMSPADDSPSEAPKAKTTEEPADITVTYTRSKITTCGMVAEDGEKSCQATARVDHSGSATVTLVPIDAEEEVDPSRSEQTLDFADAPGAQERAIVLEPGFWELEWKGESTVRQRFKVAPRDRFEITLEGIAGMCMTEGSKCKLQGAKVQQSVELPVAKEMN